MAQICGAHGVDTTWVTAAGDEVNSVGRAMMSVWLARAAVAAAYVQRFLRRRWHGGWLAPERKESSAQKLCVATWNTQRLHMGRKATNASRAKLEWLEQRLTDAELDVLALQELEGSLQALRKFRR